MKVNTDLTFTEARGIISTPSILSLTLHIEVRALELDSNSSKLCGLKEIYLITVFYFITWCYIKIQHLPLKAVRELYPPCKASTEQIFILFLTLPPQSGLSYSRAQWN